MNCSKTNNSKVYDNMRKWIIGMDNNLEILFNGQQFKKLYDRKCNQISKRYGLTRIEIEILLFLENNPSYDTAKSIVELRFYAKSHVSKAIDSLIKSGYVLVKSDEHDRRCIHVKIAPSAEQVVREANDLHHNLIEILYKNISLEEKRIMESVAKKIANNIKEALEKED
jgi:DNA-binding MarR family transcriptional regulator